MSADQLTSLTPLVMAIGAGIAWLVRRQAAKRDELDKARLEHEKQEDAERIANQPALQQIVAEQSQKFIETQNEEIRRLLQENNEQRDRHRTERRSWEDERKREREDWQKQILEWEKERRAFQREHEREKEEWAEERNRYRQIIDELRAELAPYRRKIEGQTDG